jgi:hypothetical protein
MNRTLVFVRNLQVTVSENCVDFASSAEAQKFFLSNGGPYSDPNDLDRDGDGTACEFAHLVGCQCKAVSH